MSSEKEDLEEILKELERLDVPSSVRGCMYLELVLMKYIKDNTLRPSMGFPSMDISHKLGITDAIYTAQKKYPSLAGSLFIAFGNDYLEIAQRMGDYLLDEIEEGSAILSKMRSEARSESRSKIWSQARSESRSESGSGEQSG